MAALSTVFTSTCSAGGMGIGAGGPDSAIAGGTDCKRAGVVPVNSSSETACCATGSATGSCWGAGTNAADAEFPSGVLGRLLAGGAMAEVLSPGGLPLVFIASSPALQLGLRNCGTC